MGDVAGPGALTTDEANARAKFVLEEAKAFQKEIRGLTDQQFSDRYGIPLSDVPTTRRNWLNSLEGIKWEQVEILAEYDALNQGVSDSLDPYEAFRPFGVVRTLQDVKKGFDWMRRLSDVNVGERQFLEPGSPAIGCEGQRCQVHDIDWGK